jgi:predicted ABC-type ATPase
MHQNKYFVDQYRLSRTTAGRSIFVESTITAGLMIAATPHHAIAPPNVPYLLITNGSTGSGKTKLVENAVDYLQLKGNNVKLLIDELVEQNDAYKVETLKIIQGVEKDCETNNQCVSDKFRHPDQDLLDKFSHAYFMARGSASVKITCERGGSCDCNTLLDQRMTEAIKFKKNIVFETTGQSNIDWLVDKMMKDRDYYVISAYTLVDVNSLAARMTQRTITSIRSFEKDVREPAPRLPDLNTEHIKRNQLQIIDNLLRAISKLKGNRKQGVSKTDTGINRILVYNNSGAEMLMIYDSESGSENTLSELACLFLTATGQQGPVPQLDASEST